MCPHSYNYYMCPYSYHYMCRHSVVAMRTHMYSRDVVAMRTHMYSRDAYTCSAYICVLYPQSHGVLHILLHDLLSQHRSPRLCLAHDRRYRERDRCVCVCVCVCVHMYSLSVCISLRLLCVSHLPFSQRYEVCICPRPAIFLAILCTHNVS